jgi:hypothetical protein
MGTPPVQISVVTAAHHRTRLHDPVFRDRRPIRITLSLEAVGGQEASESPERTQTERTYRDLQAKDAA